ncbi:MAG: hypothetical protein ABIS06_17790 [Vicinamibacterales bacterium]
MTSRRLLTALALLCLAGYVYVYATGLAPEPIRSDGFSYYVYLPSWFLHGDTTLTRVAQDCCGGAFPDNTGIYRWPGTRRWVNVHPIGVALMQAPFFSTAHALTRWTNLSADGFTLYYQHAAGLAGLIMIVGGLALLRRLLLRHFSDGVTSATLVTLLLGTNLYHYATFDSSYSHPYSFVLVAAFINLIAAWYQQPSSRTSVLIGVVAGLIVIVRHPNALLLNLFWMYGVVHLRSAIALADLYVRHRAALLRIVLVAALVISPQLALYYQATGQLIVSSYGELGFNWRSPRIVDVLFSVTKGLFFWSPMLVIAVAGLLRLGRSAGSLRPYAAPAALLLAVHLYVIASWWDWQLGGSYGSRGFVDVLPLFAIGLASAFEWTVHSTLRRTMVGAIVAAGLFLSVLQMLQYWHGLIPYNDMTWDQYRASFLRWR